MEHIQAMGPIQKRMKLGGDVELSLPAAIEQEKGGEVFVSTSNMYVQALKAHHAVMQWAMKCKQNIDTDFCCHMDHALDDMSKMYLPH